MKAAGHDIRLALIGDGPLRGAVETAVRESAEPDAVWLAGSRDDVAALLRAMDIFVLGSQREGISNTVLEAMASGLPVVATATGGNFELVERGVTGELVPPGIRRSWRARSTVMRRTQRDGWRTARPVGRERSAFIR